MISLGAISLRKSTIAISRRFGRNASKNRRAACLFLGGLAACSSIIAAANQPREGREADFAVGFIAGRIVRAELRCHPFIKVCHVRSPLKIVVRGINTPKAEAAKMIVVLRNVACILISQCRIIYAARDRILHYLLLLLLRVV